LILFCISSSIGERKSRQHRPHAEDGSTPAIQSGRPDQVSHPLRWTLAELGIADKGRGPGRSQ
jgi:hypothetical protein